jgi:transposase
MRYEEPLKILEIMRLWEEQGLSQRDIADSVNCSKSTVGEVQRRCRAAGITYERAVGMAHDELVGALYPKLAKKPVKDDPDWAAFHRRLQDHPRLNLQFIWTEEYRPQNPDGLSYSQFCRRYRAWRDGAGFGVTMVREHPPGKEMFVDWAGDTLDAVFDEESGRLMTAHFFITTLGCSGYPFVEAFPDEKELCWLLGHVHAFEWYGGVPRIVSPDNTKTAVTKPSHYDPVLNRAYCDLARHYGVGVIPARPRKPRDKAPVEGGVGWIETWLLEWLRGKSFFSFEELNFEIRMRMKELASRPYQERPGTRQEVFDAIDAPALRPLPASRFTHSEYKRCRVGDNYHVEYDGFYYSVPYTLFKQRVTVRADVNIVEILDEKGRRVALHKRRRSGSRYISDPLHMPEKHRRQREHDKRNGDSYRRWAEAIGESTFRFIDALLAAQTVEETAYKSCMGVLQLGKRHGEAELERACGKALGMGSVTYSTVKRLISTNGESGRNDDVPLPVHENLRDPSEFN